MVIARVLLALLLLTSIASAQGLEVEFSPFGDPEGKVLAELAQARATVDVAQYNIRSQRIFDALSAARARGVRVRIVVDAKNAAKPWNTLDDAFEAAGFDILRYTNTGSRYAIMHHKFCVIDRAVVMTGSFNWSSTAQIVNDENMLVVRDAALAAAYEVEFDELRGAPETTGPAVGAAATVYFSPEDRTRTVVLDAIRSARARILVAMFSFRDRDVARALRDAARRGVEVILVTERKQADTTTADETVASGGARVIVGANTSSPYSAMHQKFCVIDSQVVLTGACNWTYTAFQYSNEDVLVLSNPQLAQRYTEAFGALVLRYDPARFDPHAFGIARPVASSHFVATFGDTRWGESLRVVGSHPALGGWDPLRGIPLRTSGTIFPNWGGQVRLPAGTRVEWKLVVVGPWGPRWETGPNRVLVTDADGTDQLWNAVYRSAPSPRRAP